MSAVAQTIAGYLESLPDDQRAALQKLRAVIRAAAPDAVEGIGYGIPAYKYKGKPLIYFGAAKNHCAIYGASPDALKDQLTGYDTSKGTIRFSPDKPLPEALVRKLVKARTDEIEAGAGRYKKQ